MRSDWAMLLRLEFLALETLVQIGGFFELALGGIRVLIFLHIDVIPN